MSLPRRRSLLWFIAFFVAGSIGLGYDYLFIYDPPIRTMQQFEYAMSWGDVKTVQSLIVMSSSQTLDDLRKPTEEDARKLLSEPFEKERILDLRQRIDDKGTYHYVVVRSSDAQIYAFILTKFEGKLRVVISDRRTGAPKRYIWEYTWSN